MKNHKKLRNALATLLLALPLALQGAVGVKTAQAAETSTETATGDKNESRCSQDGECRSCKEG